ncbi:MAG: GntR family transcriptional regulator [Anaerolineae bacterium]|nr:GntR family transcriptional regulator [Anaerolineae bacterium]
MTTILPPEKISETDESYSRLHQAIMKGQLLPNERLVELDLAQKFDVGRAAVRAAIARLAQEGLVGREPNRGAWVRAISEHEAIELYEARAVLEGLAAHKAAQLANAQDIADLRAIHSKMQSCFADEDLLQISELNAQLHAKILAIANHQAVTQLIQRLKAQQVRFQYRTILVPGRARQSLEEHLAIVDAIAQHDANAAEQAMRSHIMNVTQALKKSIKNGF